MKTLALRARVFIHCFLVFGYPGETLALVVHILHQMNMMFVGHGPLICLHQLNYASCDGMFLSMWQIKTKIQMLSVESHQAVNWKISFVLSCIGP